MDSLLPSGYIAATKLGTGPDFTVYTSAMVPLTDKDLPLEDQNKPIVIMRGSSVIEDLQRDCMNITALQDMTHIPDSLTFWLNHSYQLPQDAYGKLYGKPKIEVQNAIADLWVAAETFLSNSAAERTYNLIVQEGARFGCSVGCMVTEWSWMDEEDKWNSGVSIDHVQLLEFSIVGIPANQRCWVENAIKGVFARSLVEGNGVAALSLAPAFRGLFTKQYDDIVRNVTSEGLKKDLERVPRKTKPERIIYDFSDSTEGFVLTNIKGTKKALSREEVGVLIEKSGQTKSITDLDETKAVCGNTALPLMDIGTAWDGAKATSQIFDYAKGDNDEINVSKAKQCHLWYDPDNADKQSGYKLPMCFVDGSPKIVPLGVRAIAGVLSGARGGASIDNVDGVKAKVKTLYGRINSQFSPDPKWQVPWEKEDSTEDIKVKEARERDNEEKTIVDEKQKAVAIGEDGSHEPFTGTHTHAHKAYNSQGDDDMHEHEHTHDGDSNHGHDHAEKAIDPPRTLTIEEPAVVNTDTPLILEGTANSTELSISHENKDVSDDPQKAVLLGIYRSLLDQAKSIGEQIGIEPVPLQKAIMPVNMDPQQVITIISQLDALVDSLMDGFGIPDIDNDDDDTQSSHYSIESQVTKALEAFFVTLSGKEVSEKNQRKLQMIHDAVKSMHPGVCGDDESDDDQKSIEVIPGEVIPFQAYFEGIDKQAEILAKFSQSLADLSVKGIIDAQIDKALNESKTAINELRIEQTQVAQRLERLKTMPLGRPTTFFGRTVTPQEDTASYTDFLDAKNVQWTLEEALKATSVVERNGVLMRHWPDGVGGNVEIGVRPRLTQEQKTYMQLMDIPNYNNGNEAYVPTTD